MNGDLAEQAGLKGIYGVIVETIDPGSPVDKAGIQSQDVLTSINGDRIISSAYLRGRQDMMEPGDVVSLGLLRNGVVDTIEVKLEERVPNQ